MPSQLLRNLYPWGINYIRNYSGFSVIMSQFFLCFSGKKVMEDNTTTKDELLPADIDGWEAGLVKNVDTSAGLYEYIDGGAELYISYGFKKLIARKYRREGQPDIKADVFDMGTSQNAFGVFGYSQETVENDFGQGSQSSDGLILFWKSRYYISLLCFPQTPESKGVITKLAKQIAASIKETGSLPGIIDLLPKEGLVKESIRYFYHYIWLNSFHFISDKNVFNIDDSTEALLAKYGEKKRRSVLLIIKYRDANESKRALKSFTRNVEPDLLKRDAIKNNKGKWTSCVRKGIYLIGIFNGESRERALGLIKSVAVPAD